MGIQHQKKMKNSQVAKLETNGKIRDELKLMIQKRKNKTITNYFF